MNEILKRIFKLTLFFLIQYSSPLFAQTYELVNQNKEWDSDVKKTHLYYKDISATGADLTITVSLEKLKIKDDSEKEYGWGASNPIPSGWKVIIRTKSSHGNLLDEQGCGDCDWGDLDSSSDKNKIKYSGEVDDPYFYIEVRDENDNVVPGLERIKVEYRITENFTIKTDSFNSCLNAKVFTVNEAFIDNKIVCDEYRLKIYDSSSTLVYDSDDDNNYTEGSNTFIAVTLDPGDYNYIITNSCGQEITGVFTISVASSFGSKILFAGYECFDDDSGGLFVKIQGAQKPISWKLKKDGKIVLEYDPDNTDHADLIGEYFTFDDFYEDAADNKVVNQFTLDILKLLDGPIEEGDYEFTFTDDNNCEESVDIKVIIPIEIKVKKTLQLDNSCSGDTNGCLKFVASGGWTEPFEDNLINPISWGDSYIFTLTNEDNGQELNPTVDPELVLNDAGDAIAGYEVTFCGLGVGNYTLTVDEHIAIDLGDKVMYQCSKPFSTVYEITEPPPLNLSSTISNISCFGEKDGEIDITVSGGTKDYTYLWTTTDGSGLDSVAEDQTGLGAGTYKVKVTDAEDCVIEDEFTITEPDELKISYSLEKDSLLCYGDTTTLKVTIDQESVSPYDYKLEGTDYKNNDISIVNSDISETSYTFSVNAGTYKITVTDANGCFKILDTIVVVQPSAPLSLVNSLSSNLCFGDTDGEIDITVSGGTTDYTYLWTTTGGSGLVTDAEDQTGLGAGTYKVKVTDDNGCILEKEFIITEPDKLKLEDSLKNNLCFGDTDGEIDITVSGGTTDYTYLWSTTDGSGLDSDAEDQTGLGAGTYKIKVTDKNGCVIEDEFTISEPDELKISYILGKDSLLCYGDETTLKVIIDQESVSPYDYKLEGTNYKNDGILIEKTDTSATSYTFNIIAGTYKVTVTDKNNCSKIIDNIVITQPSDSLSINGSVINVTGFGEKDGEIDVTVSGGTKDYTYLWTTPDGSGLDSDDEDQTGLGAGVYTVKVTDANGCEITKIFTISQPEEFKMTDSLTNISCSGADDGQIDLTVTGGTKDYSFLWTTSDGIGLDSVAEDQTGLAPGKYKVKVTDAKGYILEDSFDISEPDELKISSSLELDSLLCFGDSTTIKVKIMQESTPEYTFKLEGKNYNNDDIIFEKTNISDTTYSFNVTAGTYKITVKDKNDCQKTTIEYTIVQPDSLYISGTVTHVTGFGEKDGEIDITVSGGTKDYTYLWTTSDGSGIESDSIDQTGLSAGSYTIKVTDANGCVIRKTFIVNQPEEFKISNLITNISCNGADDGEIDITVTGGTKDYTYLWTTPDGTGLDSASEDQTGLSPGKYNIKVTDNNGYLIEDSFDITEPDSLKLLGSVTNVTGFGVKDGGVDITVTGGTTDYTYLWSTTDGSGLDFDAEDQTVLGSGTYTVKVTDVNGCEVTATFEVTQPDEFILSDSTTNISCYGADDGIIDISLTGGTKEYSFFWSTSDGDGLVSDSEDQIDLSPGSYKVVITDANGYKISGNYTITQPNEFKLSDSFLNISCYGANDGEIDITVVGGTKDYVFSWTTEDGSGLDSAEEDQTGLGPGKYKVNVTDANGCFVLDSFNISQPDPLQIEVEIKKISCSGNNDDGEFNITATGGIKDYTYLWTTSDGAGLDSLEEDQTGLGPGIYNIKVTDKNGCVEEKTLELTYVVPPVAVEDTFYVDEGGVLETTGVISNDYDIDGDRLRAQKNIKSNVNHGTVNIFPNGRLLYTHDGSETSIDSVSYFLIDENGCLDSATVFIIINPVNDLPVSEKDVFSVFEGGTIVVDSINGLLSNDIDVDGDDLRVVGPIKNVDYGSLILNTDGSFTYIHDGTDTPNQVCFTYRAYDGVVGPPAGFSEETEVCINIINRIPIDDGEVYNILEGEVLTTDLANGVLSNAQDLDPQDLLSVILDIPPFDGAFVLNTDGTFSYDHNCADDPNETFFTYFVTDGEDTTQIADTAKIVIDNECPIGNDDLYSGVDEGETLYINLFNGVLANDTDQNACDILEIKLLDPPNFGGLALNADGSFNYTHDDSENFNDEFTYLLNDGECAQWDTVFVYIRITPVPDSPPVAVEDSYECISEGDFIQILNYDQGILFNDYDEDPGQTLKAVLVKYPLHGVLILNSDGTFIYNHDGGESTTDSFTYYAVDDTGLTSDTVSVSLCILADVNDCPIPSDDIFIINEGEVIDSSLVYNDFDIEGNDLLISISSPPNFGGFIWHEDGKFTYSAPEDVPAPGPEIITFDYILTDSEDGFVSCDSIGKVTIIINYENDCPITEDDTVIIDISESGERIIDILINDIDPDSEIDTTSVRIISGPTFGDVISNIDGTITYIYDNVPIYSDQIIYSVMDYEGCESQGKITLFFKNVRLPIYNLPTYFSPNGDDFNDYFLIKYDNISIEDLSFNVKIMDRYQRIVYEGIVQRTDKIWDGYNSFTSEIMRTDFYYYEITPVEYYDTDYERKRDKIIGTFYLEKER